MESHGVWWWGVSRVQLRRLDGSLFLFFLVVLPVIFLSNVNSKARKTKGYNVNLQFMRVMVETIKLY